MQLFRDLLNPLSHAFVGQLRLAVFIDSQTDEVIVIRQAFRSFKMIARSRPVANDGGAARFNDVADGAQRVTEVFRVVFLIAAAKQRNQFTVKVDLFQRREKVIPVALSFTVVPGRNAEQQDVVGFQIFFAALAMS
ncbi:Uncharacterised protein [Raoultella planticola]|uniref:Uncharacterized protein n=1 Tax=Raoultella planticola TaxID=575 RepID=A0A485AXX0_RAOPL|nr:Uncharacterised protein [Raoultella planticola]